MIKSITANGQEVEKKQFDDKVKTGYTFTAQANQYTIDVNFLFSITIDRVGILKGTNGSNVESYDVILNQSPEFPRKSGQTGELVIANPENKQPSSAVTFVIGKTTDGQPPKNVVLRIEGCDPVLPSTKAQVEQLTTTQSSGIKQMILFSIIIKNIVIDFSSDLVPSDKYSSPRKYA